MLFTSEAACECSCAGGGLVMRWLMHVCVCVFTAEQMLHYTHQSELHLHPLLLLLLLFFVKCHHCYCACSYQTTSTENATASPAPHTPEPVFLLSLIIPPFALKTLSTLRIQKKGRVNRRIWQPKEGFYFCVCEGAKSLTLSPGLLPAASRRKTG